VGPGLVVKGDGSPYKVFTPFYGALRDYGWPAPAVVPKVLNLSRADSDAAAEHLIAEALEAHPQVLIIAPCLVRQGRNQPIHNLALAGPDDR
jgi:deoxyribodipyrimidine photolyase